MRQARVAGGVLTACSGCRGRRSESREGVRDGERACARRGPLKKRERLAGVGGGEVEGGSGSDGDGAMCVVVVVVVAGVAGSQGLMRSRSSGWERQHACLPACHRLPTHLGAGALMIEAGRHGAPVPATRDASQAAGQPDGAPPALRAAARCSLAPRRRGTPAGRVWRDNKVTRARRLFCVASALVGPCLPAAGRCPGPQSVIGDLQPVRCL